MCPHTHVYTHHTHLPSFLPSFYISCCCQCGHAVPPVYNNLLLASPVKFWICHPPCLICYCLHQLLHRWQFCHVHLDGSLSQLFEREMTTNVQNGGEVLPPALVLCCRSRTQSAILIPYHCTSSWYKSLVGCLHITNALPDFFPTESHSLCFLSFTPKPGILGSPHSLSGSPPGLKELHFVAILLGAQPLGV